MIVPFSRTSDSQSPIQPSAQMPSQTNLLMAAAEMHKMDRLVPKQPDQNQPFRWGMGEAMGRMGTAPDYGTEKDKWGATEEKSVREQMPQWKQREKQRQKDPKYMDWVPPPGKQQGI